jgi:hypothetical protein
MKRANIAILSLSILLLSSGLLFSNKAKTAPHSSANYTVSPEEPIMRGFQFTKYVFGKKIYTVNADTFSLKDKKLGFGSFTTSLAKTTELQHVEVTFYNDNKPVSTIVSMFAEMDMKQKNLIFYGTPSLMTEDNKALSADKMIWRDASNNLLAQGRCFLGVSGQTVTAERITTDVGLNNFSIGK